MNAPALDRMTCRFCLVVSLLLAFAFVCADAIVEGWRWWQRELSGLWSTFITQWRQAK